MKHYISEEEKRKQIEQMWEDYEKANRINTNKPFHSNESDFDFFDEEEEDSTNEPVRYEKLSEGKAGKFKNKKKNSSNSRKKSDKNFE